MVGWLKRAGVALAVFSICAGAWAQAQNYPVRPIRFIVPYPPGGSTDPTGRAIGQWLSEKFGQSVVVDNRGGAGSTLGHGLAAQAAPDGYTLLLGTSGGLVVAPAWGTKISYNPLKDFTPIALAVDVPFVLAIQAGVPAKSLKEFIALGVSQPGKINFASPGAGTPNHLGMELMNALAGTRYVHVPYKGGGPALLDLMGGRVDALFGAVTYIAPAVQSGKVRVIATGHLQRVREHPDAPALAELYPGFTNTTWFGVVGPAGMPPAIVNRLSSEMRAAYASPAFRKTLESLALLPITSTPAEMGERIKGEFARWSKVIKDAGIGER
ncbi:MAG: tripartite tricarboxylate transporter substrate binding protein [Betaproteobacteria bacterium]|nr:tripartite tricarboxylate transporter substrate binding protein [Betaproteobacteria bacterium]